MGIRESLLNTITSVADSDFVRIVTSAGASSKATVRNLFKGFESNLSAKSSLSDSDYIRLVGSDNEAYKQSMSSVYDAIGVKYLGSFTASSDEDIIKAALTALKTAYSSEASSSTNKPKTIAFFRSGAWGFIGTAWIRSTRTQMEVTQTNSGAQFYALDDNGTQTVIAQPTRAEMDVQAITFTPNSGFTSNLSIRKVGKVVMVNGYITATNAFGSSETIVGNIPAGSRPGDAIRAVAGVATQAYLPGDVAYAAIGTSGDLAITAKSGNTYKRAYFSISYAAQN